MSSGEVEQSTVEGECAERTPSTSNGVSRFIASWRAALAQPRFRADLLFTIVFDTILLHFAVDFFNHVESRKGVVLADPLLAHFRAVDLTWVSFFVVVGFTALGVARMFLAPQRLLVCFQAYAFLVAMRAICMYLAPFDAPTGIIVLQDPFSKAFGLGAEAPLTKDLFFSGHTSILTLAAFGVPKGRVKVVLAIAAVAIAFCVLAQKVHYTIDVAVAPFMAFGALRFVEWIREKLGLPTT